MVTVADAHGCALVHNFEIEAPPALAISAAGIEHVHCYGSNEGAIRLEMSGGAPPYAYLWNDGSNGQHIFSLAAGYYQATITDANGCQLVSPSFMVDQPAPLALSVAVSAEVSCYGGEDGMALARASGGVPPYAYYWEHGVADSLAPGLEPGSYRVSVTDANGCRDSSLAFIGEPAPLALEYQSFPPNCVGRLGLITLQALSGAGTPPFLYSIDGGTTFTSGPMFSNLEAGLYQLALLDANGCKVEETVQLLSLPPLSIRLPDGIRINYGESATLAVEVEQAHGGIRANWSPVDGGISCGDCLNPIFSPVYSTTYHLSVTDENGCRADASIQVLVDRLRRVYIPNAFSPNGDGKNDTFLIYGGQEVARVEKLIIAGRWGNILFQQEDFPPNDPQFGWDGWFQGQRMPSGAYAYQADVLFSDGIRRTYKGDVLIVD